MGTLGYIVGFQLKQEEAEKAKQALIKYGKHQWHCQSHRAGRRLCTCGLAEVKRGLGIG